MASQLINIVQFTGLTIAVPTQLPHRLNQDGRGLTPDVIIPATGDYLITADDTNVTVTRGANANDAVAVLVFQWHTLLRTFGSFTPPPGAPPSGTLLPQPFVAALGLGASAIGGIPRTVTNTVNIEGISPRLARVDHDHRLGMNAQDDGVLVGIGRPIFNFAGTGITAVEDAPNDRVTITVPTAAGDNNSVLTWGAVSLAASAGTRYLPVGSGELIATTSNDFEFHVPRAATIRNMYARHNATGGNGTNVTYTLLVNGVATPLAVTLATNAVGFATNFVNVVVVAPGDRLALTATKASSIGGGNTDTMVSVEFA
jgi:hypothetical protein